MSVLTDNRYFRGSFNVLGEISGTVRLPVLCKDFIISEVQIDHAYCHGADFILLIAAVLNVRELRILSRRAARYSMKVLYEIHDAEEFEKIRHNDLELVGVNSRDLRTFAIDKDRAMATIRVPQRLVYQDSRKRHRNRRRTCGGLRSAGADAFLIGTALMTAEDPAQNLAEFYDALEPPCS